MTTDERDEFHRCFPHRVDAPCPLEAAWSAHEDDRSLKVLVTMSALILVAAAIIYGLLPGSIAFTPRDRLTSRALVVLLTALVEIIEGVSISKLYAERAENHLIAESGPDCNPWDGLDEDERAPLSVSWKRAIPNVLWVLGLRRWSKNRK